MGSERRKRVAVVPGDDAAPEAMSATMMALKAMALPIDWIEHEPGQSLDADLADSCDTVLYGSSNGTSGGLAHLRFGWGTFANVRPVKYFPGVRCALRNPEDVDLVIVREALQDVYAGIEGDLADLAAKGVSLASHGEKRGLVPRYPFIADSGGVYGIKVYTREGVERVAEFAAKLALKRKAEGKPGRVTIGGKWNVNPRTDGFFHDVAREVIARTPEVECNAYLGDDLGRRLVACPQEFDVVLLPNLLGDLLSDVAAGGVGGLGMAPSGGYGADRAYFEPVHGSAPDIAGRNLINPAATMLSAVMMLEYLGLDRAARTLESAVRAVIADGRAATPDIGGTGTTVGFGEAVARLCA